MVCASPSGKKKVRDDTKKESQKQRTTNNAAWGGLRAIVRFLPETMEKKMGVYTAYKQ
jgi:hypothetical protein